MHPLDACCSALVFLTRSSGKIFPLLIAAAILAVACGVTRHESVCFAGDQAAPPGFLSLAKEAAFWEKWREQHRDTAGTLDPFFYGKEIQEPVDKRLIETAKHSDPFVLVVLTSANRGRFAVVSLTKNTKSNEWQQINWARVPDVKGMREVIVTPHAIQEDILKTLSNGPVFAEGGSTAFDCTSVFVFIRYQGKQNRLAAYDPGVALRERAKRDKVAAALESLLKDTVLSKRDN